MGTGKKVVFIVVVKVGRLPIRACGMAVFALARQTQLHMLWIGTLIEYFTVTFKAKGRCFDITIGVAIDTIRLQMATGKWIIFIVVIELSWLPTGNCCMAALTIIGKFKLEVIGIRRLIVFWSVAIETKGGRACISVGVAIAALGCDVGAG